MVYPRVGGGNRRAFRDELNALGLSPRGRGKPVVYPQLLRYARSIPAWAGETIETDFAENAY